MLLWLRWWTTVGTSALSNASTTSLEVSSPEKVASTDVLEFGSELVLVSDKSQSNILTVARGYMGTPINEVVLSGTQGIKNPRWPRFQVKRALEQAVSSGLVAALPEVHGFAASPLEDSTILEVAADIVDVTRVAVLDSEGRVIELSRWDFLDHLPATMVPDGKAIQVQGGPDEDDTFWCTGIRPYHWYSEEGVDRGIGGAPTEEEDYVKLPVFGDDLPMLWAAAKMATGRELSRGELDRVEEWNQEAAIAQGVNIRLIRELWGEFYRRVDEVRKHQPVKKHRPYQRMRSF